MQLHQGIDVQLIKVSLCCAVGGSKLLAGDGLASGLNCCKGCFNLSDCLVQMLLAQVDTGQFVQSNRLTTPIAYCPADFQRSRKVLSRLFKVFQACIGRAKITSRKSFSSLIPDNLTQPERLL